ncbi:hypothetical protein C8J55DRAFT_518162 [Lentinula edodes]|uniref:Uncharacterized protein n=1 Tax=Lentinula lateritia TaxID=40482 RepID=A0A9W9A509_9AGAR|nr:hypothetical protein C8J55DRAFT_518162 [Lentinula edodes]
MHPTFYFNFTSCTWNALPSTCTISSLHQCSRFSLQFQKHLFQSIPFPPYPNQHQNSSSNG